MLSPVARKKDILEFLLNSFLFLLVKLFPFQDAFCVSTWGSQFSNLAEMAS